MKISKLLIISIFSIIVSGCNTVNVKSTPKSGISVKSVLKSKNAVSTYNNKYKYGSSYKAFAQSRAGYWGFVMGMGSQQGANKKAIISCQKRIKNVKVDPCEIVNMNGKWVK